MAANTDFFQGISPQAVLKHGILTRYAYYFAGKAGKATNGKVAFIDGYAGEGRYADGNHGSPLLLASSSERAKGFNRDIKLAFVEQDEARRRQLRNTLKKAGVEPDQLLGGAFGDVVGPLLDSYIGRATLVFVDPFGLALDRSQLESILRRSGPRQPIDVLFHFSLLAVARMARAELATKWKGGPPGPNAAKLDAALGGVDWRETFATSDDEDSATQIALKIAEQFGQAVGRGTGVRHTSIEVRERPGHLPKYLLMLFTRLDVAHWDFADLAGGAHVDWLQHCDTASYREAVRQREERGALSLFDEFESEPDRATVDKQVAQDLTPKLTRHLADLLKERHSLRPIDDVAAIYGPVLGRARGKHVRAAFRQLHRDGLIDDDCRGDFFARQIRWRGPR